MGIQTLNMRFILLVLVSCASLAFAHESCCNKKAQGEPELIPDPEDPWTEMIEDLTVTAPPGWDEEDDGPFEPPLIENPIARRMIPNPAYKPPPGLVDEMVVQVQEATPWVLIGVLVTALMGALQLPLESLKTALEGERSQRGLAYKCFKGSLIGLATPLCSCGALPVAASLAVQGVPLGVVVAFLTASQSAGLDSAAITWGLLGPTATAARLIGAVAIATLTGLAAPHSVAGAPADAKAPTKPAAQRNICLRLIISAMDTTAEVVPSILLGLGLSILVKHSLPAVTTLAAATIPGSDGAFDFGFIGQLLSRLLVIASALPLQLCEHSTVTLAAGIQKAGGSAGLAFAFLLSAPATNLPSLLMLLRAQNSADRSVLAVVRVVLAMTASALCLSYVVDAIGLDLLVQEEANSGGGSLGLPGDYMQYSPYAAAGLVGATIVRAINARFAKQKAD